MAERKLSGVRVSLPRLTRVRAVSHDAYSGATLTYDDERRDYELCKLESVPGVREEDPLNGAKVALPPQNYTWDPEQLLWVHSRSKQPYASMIEVADGRGSAKPGNEERLVNAFLLVCVAPTQGAKSMFLLFSRR